MKTLYTIGETARLLGVTTQTLRHYDKIGLLSPDYVDPSSGYRYYRYQQFHLIDRIKYLQGFGIPLQDIRLILCDGRNDYLLRHLYAKREDIDREIGQLESRRENLDWFISYCSYMDEKGGDDQLYTIYQPEQYIIKSPCYYKEPLAQMEIRLAEVKSRPAYRNETFNRQYGYRLDMDSLFRGEFYPKEYFTYFSGKPALDESLYSVIPAGEYLCVRTQILHEDWDTSPLEAYFAGRPRPEAAFALEFEDNLIDWSDAWYEVQILLRPDKPD